MVLRLSGGSAGSFQAQRRFNRQRRDLGRHRGQLFQAEDHLRPADIVDRFDFETFPLQVAGKVGSAVMGDVLVRIAAR